MQNYANSVLMNVSSFLQIQKSSYLKIILFFFLFSFPCCCLLAAWCCGGCSAKDERGEDKWLLSLLFGSWGPQWLPEGATHKNHNKVAEAL